MGAIACAVGLGLGWPVWGSSEPHAWEDRGHYRLTPLQVGSDDRVGLARMGPDQTGVTFTNRLSEDRALRNRNLTSGSGVAAGDVDGDGRTDLYFCRLEGENALYRNLGDWQFEEITERAGVACPDQDSMGAALTDINGNGDLDLLVTALGGGVRLFLNEGDGHFQEATESAGLASDQGSTSMALADVDGDKDLDLYVANYRPDTIKDRPSTRFQIKQVNGKPVVARVNGRPTTHPSLTNRFELSPSGKVIELGQVDHLYLNDGEAKFSEVSFTEGRFRRGDGGPLKEPPRGWGLAARFHDINQDGRPDLYVCNDFASPDNLWLNQGDGTFQAIPRVGLRKTSTFSMGVDFADADRDGHVDFFVTDMVSRLHSNRQVQIVGRSPSRAPIGWIKNRPQRNRNTFQRNRGDTTFAEMAYYSGIEASEWSWGPVFLDVDLDGYEDLMVPNGQLFDFQNVDVEREIERLGRIKDLGVEEVLEIMKGFPRLETANVLFRNNGDLTWTETGKSWGFETGGISHGMALADLDNDGDLDVVVNNLHQAAGLYRNGATAPRVAVRLKGEPPNTQGIGARIYVEGGPVPQYQEVIAGGRYLSDDQAIRTFAAGDEKETLTIRVLWPSGRRSVIEDASPDHLYEIRHGGEASPEGMSNPPHRGGKRRHDKAPYFEDWSERLNHRHKEAPFDDFERQPLIPYRLSQSGPGVAWHDLTGNGWDDLMIGGGRSGELAIYLNRGEKGLRRIRSKPATNPTRTDQTGLVAWEPNPKTTLLTVGRANDEPGPERPPSVRLYDLSQGVLRDELEATDSMTGPLAVADIDGDGDLDGFVGGRARPGEYPRSPRSLLLRNASGQWVVSKRWDDLGMVSGGVFSDLDQDGYPELILACDWGPIRVFDNDQGTLRETTEELGLDGFRGWWRGVATGDLNGNGRLDIIATNWGLNSRYRRWTDGSLRLYYGDLDGNGTVEPIETGFNPAVGTEVPLQGLRTIRKALPDVGRRIPNFSTYGRSGFQEIFGSSLDEAAVLEANRLASMIFLNRGDHFESRPLPMEAQITPGSGVCVADMNGDGHEDLFMSQNFFGTHPSRGRQDAGRGLWLEGDGNGDFEAVPGHITGVKVYGEQRGCAVADFDRDGRIDLAVTQNARETRLYRNRLAKPGLRVRLRGPEGNPTGVGASIRLKSDGQWGPLREVQAGSGYWSQNSATEVMAAKGEPEGLRIRWPGGKVSEVGVPKGAREVRVSIAGEIEGRR